MLKQRFLSRKNRFFLLFFLLAFPFFLFPLSPSGSFFTALSLRKQHAVPPEKINSLLRRASISAPEPMKTEARTALLTMLYKQGHFTSVVVLGKTFLESGSSSEKIVSLVSAVLYKEKRYGDLSALLAGAGHVNSPVLFRYRVLVRGILREKDRNEILTRFLVTVPGDPGQPGQFSVIEKIWKKYGLFHELSLSERALLLFKVYTEQKKYHKAVKEAVFFLQEEKKKKKSSVLLSFRVIDEIVSVSVRSRQTGEVLALINSLLPSSGSGRGTYSRRTAAHLFWGAGYLSGKRGKTKTAAGYFKKGLVFAGPSFSDKLLWYWFSAEFRRSPFLAFKDMNSLMQQWHNPGYFSDILSDLATFFVRRGQWNDIRAMLVMLQGKAADDILSRLSYLAARGADEGYFPADNGEILQWYAAAIKHGRGVASGLYYKIMAQAALRWRKRDKVLETCGRSGSEFCIFVHDEQKKGIQLRSYDQLLFGAIEYNLPEYGKTVIEEYPDSFSMSGIRRFAEFLAQQGDYLNSIRIMSRYAGRNGYRVTGADIKILYPLGYRKIISSVRKKEHLPVPVFTALIREESHFSPTIVSAAGAVGLSQLMPSTAGDVARRMGLRKVDITRPDINAALGGWYLGNLLKRTDTVLDALFAYNGGLTRVRRWKKTYRTLPEDLFLEVLPYKETSLYGRKVIVSAVVYGSLYFSQTPVKVIHLFMNKRF